MLAYVRRLELAFSESGKVLLACRLADESGHVIEFANAASLVRDLGELKAILLERGVILPFSTQRWFLPVEVMMDKIEAGQASADWVVREPLAA